MQFDLIQLIQTVGYVGLFIMVFGESGFFLFFLPGDSLLFTAGILASQGVFSIWVLAPLFTIAAILGDSAGYWVGNKSGSWLLRQKDSFLFKKSYIHKAQEFFNKHGGKALILARFVPAVRTFVPVAAGMGKMDYGKFLSYNIIGAIIWGAGMSLLGYFLGSRIENIDRYLIPIIGVIIIISVLPALFHMKGDIVKIARKNKTLAKILKVKEDVLGDTPL